MSKRASPTAIGLFMLGALVLAIIGIVTFVSASFFGERHVFVSYFEESVNGLEVGAPVKFKGVPVGRVTQLLISIDMAEQTFMVPVLYEIDLTRLTTEAGTYVNFGNAEVLRSQVRDGLRAQLQMESFVTGLLYVELTYVSNPDVPEPVAGGLAYPQIPTKPSLLAGLGEEAGQLASDLRAFDVGELNQQLMSLLENANQKLEGLDAEAVTRSLVEASEAIEALARSEQIEAALAGVPALSQRLDSTLVEAQAMIRRLSATIDPLQGRLDATNEEVVVTLQALREAIEGTQGAFSTDSGLGYRVEEALISLTEAAEALRLLARSLEQNPDALIRGKAQPENQP